MPAFFGIACASWVGSVGLEEAELVGIQTEPFVDAEAFAMGPVVRFDGDEVEVGAPMVTRCARHRGVAHDGADFFDILSCFARVILFVADTACRVPTICVPFAIPYLELTVEVAGGGYDGEGDAVAEG